MKPTLTTLFLVCISTIALSQEYRIEIGSRTGCTGRGICTIESPPDPMNKTTVNSANASIIQTKEGVTLLRIYREQLTQEEQDRVLGVPIMSKSKNVLEFTMEEALPLPEDIIAITAATRSRQISVLKAKTYPTVISDTYIDITIVAPENNIKTKD
ncbi:MAG: hypothetical protein ACI9Y7_002518 [Dokdonia sp.]|jgi:hypothetical protein